MLSNKVAVVILNWNGKSFLEKFLPNVIKFSSSAQIIVADNNSTDDSVEFLKIHFPQVKTIINNVNEGFAKGYNTALRRVDAHYYVLLNSDVEVSENWIEPIVSLLDSNKQIAACQPKILDYHHKNKFEYAGASGGFIDIYGYPFCRGRIFNTLEEDKGQYNNAIEVFWASGACLFLRAEAFWKVGGFDDDYFAHMEEIDLCWRMKNSGYKIYVEPQSIVHHVGGGTLNKISPRKTFLNFRNNLITLTKNAPAQFLFFKIIYRMILDAVAAIKFLCEGKGSHFIAIIKSHFSFYTYLPSTIRKRKAIQALHEFKNSTTCIYKKNMVYEHFVKHIRYYSDLK
jgi:GT2 family glycosyltransferase